MIFAYAAFFLSGATALLFEGFWLRQMTLVMGSSPRAFTIVTSVTILGLGVGTFLYPRGPVSSGRHPFRVPAIVLGIYSTINLVVLVGGFARLFLLALCSILSGLAIASVVTAWGRKEIGNPGGNGHLFGVNFTGGSIGVAAGGFFLIPLMGTRNSILTAFLMGLVAAILYEFFGHRAYEPPPMQELRPGAFPTGEGRKTFLPAILVAATGCTGIGMEVLWGRWISQMAGSSVYTYYSILAVSVSAFGIGCFAASSIKGGKKGKADAFIRYLFLSCSVLYPALSLGFLVALNSEGFTLFHLVAVFRASLQGSIFLATVLLVFPPLFASGVFFSQVLEGRASTRPPDFRICFLANCVGAVAGGILIPFLFVPSIGMGGSLVMLCMFNLVPSFFLLHRPVETGSGRRFRSIPLLLSLTFLMGSAQFLSGRPVSFLLPQTLSALEAGAENDTEPDSWWRSPVFYREGSFSTVIVGKDQGNNILIVDGKPESNAIRDRATQTMLAHLAFLVRGETFGKILLVGLGSGATLTGILAHRVERVDCAEISAEVVEAVREGFGADSGDAVRDPRVRITVEDGRRFLQETEVKYDLVVSQPSNPWVLGASSLFTREAFLGMASTMTPSGLAVIWFQTYGVDPEVFSLELETIRSVFPNVIAFSYIPGDVIFLCSRAPMVIDLSVLEEQLSVNPPVTRQLLGIGIRNATDFLGGFFGAPPVPSDRGDARGGDRRNTDDWPVLEYSLARSVGKKDPYLPYSVIVSPLEETIRCLEGAPSACSGPWGDFLLEWGESACRRGFCRFSEMLFLASMRSRGKDARILNNLGIVRFEQNDYNGAKRYFEEALSLDPNHGPARENRLKLTGRGYGAE